jgi:hypothetical protein
VSLTLFTVATAPARLLGWFRADLQRSVAADTARFRGAGSVLFAAVAVTAVLYPLVASAAHAYGPPTTGGDPLGLALRPLYDVVYAESLPFMLAAVAIGLFSPALGVLFMLVFIPADLWAAEASKAELVTYSWFSSLPTAVAARLASLGLLWILAVEIPLLTRRWALAWAGRGDVLPGRRAVAVGRVAGAGLLVFLWARALPWLIPPAFTWTSVQIKPRWASDPTWFYWWILVLAAMLAAGLTSAVSPRDPELMLESVIEERQRPRRSLAGVLLAQFAAVLVLSLLLGGLMTTRTEAEVLIAALVGLGPVLTPILPRLPVPAALGSASRPTRWILGVLFAFVASGIVFALGYDALFAENYLVLIIALAAAALVLRIVVEGGRARLTRAGVLLAILFSLAAPVSGWADDCADTTVGEARSCANHGIGAAYPMLGAALAAIATGIAMAKGRPDEDDLTEVFPSGYRRYARPSLGDRLWRPIRRFLSKDKYEVKTPRAVSGVRG